jgi:Bifunctional DNA primase/polymerase, N-terminal/AAA domain/Primase C terminal 2 (PriCT-2)
MSQDNTQLSPFATQAKTYATQRGWQVFPAPISGEKKGLTSADKSNGNRWGSTKDPQLIDRYCTSWPKANCGVATGEASGIFVVEADTKEGHDVDGIASLRQLEAEHGTLPQTLMAQSPSGSLHYYFKYPRNKTIRNSQSELAPGIDVRGEGGMVIAPPSVRSDGAYKWFNDNAIVNAPDWLIDLTADNDAERIPSNQPTAATGLNAPVINDELPTIDPDVPRHTWFAIGCALFRELGDEEGFTCWNGWSTAGKKYKSREMRAQWASIVKANGYGYSINSIHRAYDAATLTDAVRAIEINWEKMVAAYTAKQMAAGPLVKTSKQFVAGFVPPDYVVDGMLQEGFVYSFTGSTGSGKTVITLLLAASVALGQFFAGRETKQKRVLYFAAENPDDVRMRWIALSGQMGFDVDDIDVFFVEGAATKISRMASKLRAEAIAHGGDFGMVIVDTGPVFYEGDDENNRTQQIEHAKRMRSLVLLIPGHPVVMVNCHPTKNAAPDNLIPAGGGSFLNQVDGNLTAAISDSTTEVHWQGKFRGVEFAPMHFEIKTVTDERLKDSKGQLIPTVICEWISDTEKEEKSEQKVRDEDALLALIASAPDASLSKLAEQMGWFLYHGAPNKMRAQRHLKALKRTKLVTETRSGNYQLTEEGEKIVAGLPAKTQGRPWQKQP